jgi:hypothetical protein
VGDAMPGEVFTRATVAFERDNAGLWTSRGVGVKRDNHYIGGVRKMLIETTKTNRALFNRDMTNAAWVKTTMTAAKDQTGIDNVANAASSLTATAANATVLQAIVLASGARAQSAFVKRITGVGVIQMTMDGGTTWTAIPVTGAYVQVSIPTQTLANPSFGFRIVTSGDAIAVDMVQNEDGIDVTTPIATAGAIASRNTDDYRLPFFGPQRSLSLYAKLTMLGVLQAGTDIGRVFSVATGSGASAMMMNSTATVNRAQGWYNNGTATTTIAPAKDVLPGDNVEYRFVINQNGSITVGTSVGATAEVTGNGGIPSGGLNEGTPFINQQLCIGGALGGIIQMSAWEAIKVVQGVHSLATLQAA